ncbi:MAG TPA: biotin/lipoyl-binding protein, partial [Urbifossiella sp.]|nr:biotin/lipoyl-binding protein [Urbifossiella sp.]
MKAAVPCLAAGIAFLAGAGLTAQPPRPGAAKGWEFSGTTKVSATVELRPRVAGPLVRIPAKDGAVVRKGDLLAEIDPRPYRAKLGAAEAGVAAAEAKVRRAELDLKRAEEVARRGIVSPEEFKRVQAAIVAE